MKNLQYFKILSEQYPTVESATDAIVTMSAWMKLPKGTEYYFSDLHGEHEAFIHLLRTASGTIRDKIDLVFGKRLTKSIKDELALLVYYPHHFLRNKRLEADYDTWCVTAVNRLILLFKEISAKYSRHRVHSSMDSKYRFLLDELLVTDTSSREKEAYLEDLILSVIENGIADELISAMCHLIRQLAVDKLHILGDIFDRGPHPDKIVDELMNYSDVDIQWGNHDIEWIGAMCGNPVCAFSILRIGLHYNCFDMLEDGYGINLRRLTVFAEKLYENDPCLRFYPHLLDENQYDPVTPASTAKIHKAVAVILFKLEGQLICRHPEFGLDDRLMLDKIDFENGAITLDDVTYPLSDTCFPTIDPDDPYALTEEEQLIADGVVASFVHSAELRRHIDFIVSHGSMYKSINGNLLYHGCIPMEKDGSFKSFSLRGTAYSGKALLDMFNQCIRKAWYSHDPYSIDLIWYMWCGNCSPLYGKEKMTTFERYFIDDEELCREELNPYYTYYDDVDVVKRILTEFGLDPERSRIINGHVPVRKGESPVKADGRLFVIDGGISKAYRSTTGIGGYTLIFNSHSITLAAHKPFVPSKVSSADTFASTLVVEKMPHRILKEETTSGIERRERIEDLKQLLQMYRDGTLPEATDSRL